MTVSDPGGPSSSTVETQAFERLRLVLTVAWTQGKTALAVIGAAIYGVTRISIDAFYAKFGLAPEDVGLTEARILGRAALYFLIIAAVAVLLFSLGWMVFNTFFRAGDNQAAFRYLVLALLVLLGIGEFGIVPILAGKLHSTIYYYLTSGYRPFLSFTAGQIFTAAEVAVYGTLFYALYLMRRSNTNSWAFLATCIAVTALLITLPFPLAYGRGAQIASAVIDHEHPVRRLQYEIVTFRSDPVCVIWEADPLKMSGYYFYLGSADNKIVLYEPVEQRVLRLPSNGATIIGFPDIESRTIWLDDCNKRLQRAFEARQQTQNS